MRIVAALLCLCGGGAGAQVVGDLAAIPFAEAKTLTDATFDFEEPGAGPEPGRNIDEVIAGDGLRIGERLSFQPPGSVDWQGGRFDAPERVPAIEEAPLSVEADPLRPPPVLTAIDVVAGAAGRNLSVALHRGIGSAALFPLGPEGFPRLEARGEGAAAVVFAADQPVVGLRLHLDYADPLGGRPVPGPVFIGLYDRFGGLIGSDVIDAEYGVIDWAVRTTNPRRGITGIVIQNRDHGGIAIDDILYRLPDILG